METEQTTTERRVTPSIAVTESYRTVIRCKYHGPTNHRGSRITVSRYENTTHGKDPHRLTVGWDYSLNVGENYAEAVRGYITRAEWGGHWRVGLITDGAVAVWVGHCDEAAVSQ